MAHSIVPEVEGAANRFWLICCMIKPAILNPEPASKMANNLGTRLNNKSSQASELPFISDTKVKLATPTKSEEKLNTSKLAISAIGHHIFNAKISALK